MAQVGEARAEDEQAPTSAAIPMVGPMMPRPSSDQPLHADRTPTPVGTLLAEGTRNAGAARGAP